MIWENRHSCKDWENLLFLSLEVGFRHHDPHKYKVSTDLPRTENYREFAEAVFKSNRREAIEDLLCALIMSRVKEPTVNSFSFCKRYIIDLYSGVTAPIPPRLRQLIIRSIGLIGCKGFEEVGPGRTVELFEPPTHWRRGYRLAIQFDPNTHGNYSIH